MRAQLPKTALHEDIYHDTANSSLVEYDILFTKDKTRKIKRWIDGTLKYNEISKLALFISAQ